MGFRDVLSTLRETTEHLIKNSKNMLADKFKSDREQYVSVWTEPLKQLLFWRWWISLTHQASRRASG